LELLKSFVQTHPHTRYGYKLELGCSENAIVAPENNLSRSITREIRNCKPWRQKQNNYI